ncbi:MAG: pentapeptide repeat-containing protein, partial [Sphaerospermopsis kisseleviana]
MKRQLLAAIALAAPLFFVNSVQAGNTQDLQKLLSTGECPKCQLSGVNLRGAHLIGADLRGANLRGANL